MIISLVVAASTNNAIGKDNKLLWHLPNDLRFFKNTTWAMPVLMGRKTLSSLNFKPLKGRLNLVLTKKNDFQPEGATVVHSLEAAIAVAEKHNYKELMVLGGGEVYRHTIERADKIYLTRVHHVFADADTFFPEINEANWQLIMDKPHEKDEKHAYDYNFQLWQKKDSVS